MIYGLKTSIDELLASGADALARDSFGNDVLHYITTTPLGENDRIGDEQRHLLKVFLNPDVGVDERARNAAGVSALEIFLSIGDDDICMKNTISTNVIRLAKKSLAPSKACYVLTEPNGAGETVLYVVARLGSGRAYE